MEVLQGLLYSLIICTLVIELSIVRALTVEIPGLTVYSKDDLLRY